MKRVWNLLINEESGQAVVEYVLVLVVVVGMILGGLYQLNSAFRVWADSYFGDYLACLLETGELPTLGGGGTASGECNQFYKPFSLADGRAADGSDAFASNSNGTTGETGTNNEDSGKNSGLAANSGGSAIVQTRSTPGGDIGSSRRFRVNRSRAGGPEAESNEGSQSQTGTGVITDLSGYENGKIVRIPIRSAESIAGAKRKKGDEKGDDNKKIAVPTSENRQVDGPQYIKVDRRVANAGKTIDGEGFSFGFFLRYLLIAAIIIAILFFIGGQILQVSKSMD